MTRLILRLLLVIALVGGLALAAVPAFAQDSGTSGPTLTLSESSVDPGGQITVIFTGWQGRLVTLSVCGNLAKRGSSDCNMPASQGVRLYHVDDSPLTSFVVSAPPGTCPCVIRASADSGEVAYAPIEVRGVPIGPVVDPFSDDAPLEVSVDATPRPDGILDTLRSWLGGPTSYEVKVMVHNQATEAFSAISVHGAVGRSSEVDLAGFDLQPGAMSAGQTWTGTAQVSVPAPVIGDFDWQVLASGAGPVTETSSSTRAVPWLLIALVLALVGDVVAVVVRWVQRRRSRVALEGQDGSGDVVLDERPAPPTTELVGAGV